MAEKTGASNSETIDEIRGHGRLEMEAPMEHIAEYQQAEHVNLTWRSWVVVFVACFGIMAQVFVVVAAGK